MLGTWTCIIFVVVRFAAFNSTSATTWSNNSFILKFTFDSTWNDSRILRTFILDAHTTTWTEWECRCFCCCRSACLSDGGGIIARPIIICKVPLAVFGQQSRRCHQFQPQYFAIHQTRRFVLGHDIIINLLVLFLTLTK